MSAGRGTFGPAAAPPAARRLVAPATLSPRLEAGPGLPTYVVVAFVGIALHLTVSSNFITMLGFNYAGPGGSPLTKIHPGSYVIFAAFALMLWQDRMPIKTGWDVVRQQPVLTFYLVMMTVCMVYAMASTGFAPTTYVESFFPAGAVAIILGRAGPDAHRRLARLMTGLILLNAVMALIETARGVHFLPVYLGNFLQEGTEENFRALALYDHPLTGASTTMLAIFLLIGMRVPPLPKTLIFLTYVLALLAFGGRTAAVVTLVILGLWGVASLLARIATRRLTPRDLATTFGAVVVLPALIAILVSETTLGSRIINDFYWDSSANVRAIQWGLLRVMNWHDLWFGIDYTRESLLMQEIGLEFPYTDIENFWLLLLVNLGVVGYTFFLLGFVTLLVYVWRRVPLAGKLLLVSTIAVASSSNSLGRKTGLLTILIPAALVTSAYGRREAIEPAVAMLRPRFRERLPEPGANSAARSRWKPMAMQR